MKPSYKRLWKKLIDLDIGKTQLADMAGVSISTVGKLGRNGHVTVTSLLRICKALNCELNEIVEFVEEKK